jgi:hypothetical protein
MVIAFLALLTMCLVAQGSRNIVSKTSDTLAADRAGIEKLFFAEGSRLRLAPAFDQVSMLYAPTGDGQVPPRAAEYSGALKTRKLSY